MRIIFLFEWKRLSRNPVNILLLLFFLASGFYSIFYGAGVVQKQKSVIDSVQNAFNSKIMDAMKKFKVDTTTKQGQIDYKNASNPSSVNYLIKPPVIFFPNAFSVLAIGQRDVLPFYKEVSAEKSFIQAYEPDISNPEILAEGNLDLSFVIIYLMPLLMIALSFNVIAQEREDGTFLLLSSQSAHPDRILLNKLLFRATLVFSVTLILNAFAIYHSSHIVQVDPADVVNWILIVAVYLFFWFAICYLFISFYMSSIAIAFYLSGCWLLLSIIMPFLLNFYMEMIHPTGIRADMALEQRKIEEEVWDIKPKNLIYNFYRHHPEYKTGNLSDTLQYSPRRFAAYYDELERRLAPLSDVYKNKIIDRNSMMNHLADFVPTLKTQKMLNQIGNSDLKRFAQFDQSTIEYQKRWQAFIYRFIFTDRNLQENDYQRFPKHLNIPALDRGEILKGVMQLFLVAMLLISIRFYIIKNSNN